MTANDPESAQDRSRTIGIIGAGNIGQALSRTALRAGWSVVIANSRGPDTSIPLKPFAISVGSHESLRGDVPLPDGFSPRETTIKVLDRPDGKLLGMRVMHVQ